MPSRHRKIRCRLQSEYLLSRFILSQYCTVWAAELGCVLHHLFVESVIYSISNKHLRAEPSLRQLESPTIKLAMRCGIHVKDHILFTPTQICEVSVQQIRVFAAVGVVLHDCHQVVGSVPWQYRSANQAMLLFDSLDWAMMLNAVLYSLEAWQYCVKK